MAPHRRPRRSNVQVLGVQFWTQRIQSIFTLVFATPIKCENIQMNDLLLNPIQNALVQSYHTSYRIHRLRMKAGNFWQQLMGACPDVESFEQHPFGLDLLSSKRRFAMELKNRYNTDNASARKANLGKLALFKQTHPEFIVIYGVINDTTAIGQDKTIHHEGKSVRYLSGHKLLQFMFGDEWEMIVNIAQEESKAFFKAVAT